MNMMLTKTIKSTAFLLFFAALAVMLTIPSLAFSQTFGKDAVEEVSTVDGINSPVKVVLVVDGEVSEKEFFPVECGEFLLYNGIEEDDIDYVNVSSDTVLQNNMLIDVATVEYETVTVEELAEYGYDLTEVDTVPKGETKVIEEGVYGKKLSTYLIKRVDGVEVLRETIAEEMLVQPINGKAEYGIGGTVTAKDGTVYTYSYKRLMEATAYTYVPGKTTWTTATGERLRKGIVAVDPREIPMHTEMYIASDTVEYGYGIAEDTGGVIKGNIIDLAYMTYDECIQFGRRNMWVYFLEK